MGLLQKVLADVEQEAERKSAVATEFADQINEIGELADSFGVNAPTPVVCIQRNFVQTWLQANEQHQWDALTAKAAEMGAVLQPLPEVKSEYRYFSLSFAGREFQVCVTEGIVTGEEVAA